METWRPVVGFEQYYEVSNIGNVRSVSRYTKHNYGGDRFFKGRVLIQSEARGYKRCTFSIAQAKSYHFVHILVAQAFISLRRDGLQINHKDGNKGNNIYSNLEWVTPSENLIHAVKHGLKKPMLGENNPKTKLKAREVVRIKSLLKSGNHSVRNIASKFNVSPGAIYGIKKGFNWAHIC